jgi:ribosomal protein S18 acetylase RimI-like enzyme
MEISTLFISNTSHTQEADLQRIGELLSQLSGKRTEVAWEHFTRLTDANARIFLARENTEHATPIMGLACLFTVRTLRGCKGLVEDVVVDESCRGQGISRKLMEKLIEEARSMSMTSLELTSHPSREAANHLYRKLGFSLRETNCYRLAL